MQTKVLFIIFILSGVICHAQSSEVYFDYDLGGNRIKRYLIIQQQNNIPDSSNNARKELKSDSTGIQVLVFPNPMLETEVNVQVSGLNIDEKLNYVLIDINGRVLDRNILSEGTQKINTRILPSGSYILNVEGDRLKKKWKLIK